MARSHQGSWPTLIYHISSIHPENTVSKFCDKILDLSSIKKYIICLISGTLNTCTLMSATRGTFPTPPTLPRLSRATSVRTGAVLTGQSSPRVLACPTFLGWWDPFPPKYPPCPLLSQPTTPHATLHTSTVDHSRTYHRVSLNFEADFSKFAVCFGCLNLSGKRTNAMLKPLPKSGHKSCQWEINYQLLLLIFWELKSN